MVELSPPRWLEEKPSWKVTVQEAGKDRALAQVPVPSGICHVTLGRSCSASLLQLVSSLGSITASAERTDWKHGGKPCPSIVYMVLVQTLVLMLSRQVPLLTELSPQPW